MRKHGFALLLVFLLTSAVFAPVDGYKTGKYNSSSGCSCHTSSSTLTPTLSGQPVEYTPGATYTLSIGISTTHNGGGFSLEASDGTFSNPASNTQVITDGSSATHTTWTDTSWGVDWTAPSAGTGSVTLSLAVLGANGQQNKGGDAVGTSSYSIAEVPSTNTPPALSNLAVSPLSPITSDTLVASYIFNDPDGDTESGSTFSWRLNGTLVPSITGPEVSSLQTTKHQSWTVEVTPSDGTDSGQSVMSPSTTILNTLPSVSTPVVSTQTPSDSMDITYTSQISDADGDDLAAENQWILNGAAVTELNNATTLPSVATRDGDVWQVRVRADDGEGTSAWMTSEDIIVGTATNTPPVSSNVQLTGSDPFYTTDALSMSWDEFDENGDAITQRSVRWLRDGLAYTQADELVTLPSTMTTKGESWIGEVRLFDGTSWSSWASSSPVTIANTPPAIIGVNLTSPTFTVDDGFELTYQAQDDDGDTIEVVEVTWKRNGIPLEGETGRTLPPSTFVRGDEISAELKISDSVEETVLQTAVVEVLNAVPSVSIEWPSEVNSLVPLTPIVTATDGDQDDLSLVYSWFKNGFRDSSMDGMTVLSEQRMEPGQEWSLVIVANDGTVNSTPVERSITIENIVPRADIRFVSTDAWLGETVHLSADESFDADSRITQYQWAWAEGTGNGDTLSFVLERNTQVFLTVIDEHGGENTTQINIIPQDGPRVSDLEIIENGGKVTLSWNWNGDVVQYNVLRNGERIDTVNETQFIDSPPLTGTIAYAIEPVNDERTFIAGTSEGSTEVEVPIIETPQASQAAGTALGILILFASIAILAPHYLRRGEVQ